MTNILSQKAVLSTLSISLWSARKLDRDITDQVNQSHNAESDAGRYNKLLIDKDALKEITRIASEARQMHYQMTQPWLDDGARILPTALYADYARKVRQRREDFEKAARAFADNYPKHVDDAKKRLNGMFKATDYPNVSEIRRRFGFSMTIFPCPDAKDFRVELADGQAEDIRADIEAKMQEALQSAMQEPIRRILDVVGHMSERLKAYKPATKPGQKTEGAFRDSLVQNVKDLVDLLPAFNLTGDKALAQITQRMKDELCRSTPDTLRESKKIRASVAAAADEILAQAAEFMK